VHVQVCIAGSDNEASPELKWILAQLVLPVSGGSGPFTRQRIIATQKVKERALQQAHGAIRLPLGIDQKRERDAGLLAKRMRVVSVAQADGGKLRAFVVKGLCVAAQLRDVLAAEDSSVVAKEDDHGGVIGPERAQPDRASCRVWQDDFREFPADRLRLRHDIILK
jgi:hypothetical protein